MSNTRPGRSLKALLVYIALLVGSFILIAVSFYIETKIPFVAHMSRDIGISGIVGFILAMTFEQLSAAEFRRLTEEERVAIKRDVFYYALGHYIPQPIRDEIDAQILQSDFIREGFVLDFELRIIKDPQTYEPYMLTTCTMSYKVKKLTKDPPPFPFDPAVDKSPVASLADETKFISLRVQGSRSPFQYDEQYLRGITNKGETEISLQMDKSIYVLDQQPTQVDLKYQAVRFLNTGHLDFDFTSHTCDLDLTVRALDPNIKVFAAAPVKGMLEETTRAHPEQGLYNWKINRPLLAHQGISISWRLDPLPGTGGPGNKRSLPIGALVR